MSKIIKDEQLLVNSLMATLPAIPIVHRYVEDAIKISKKYLECVKRDFDVEDNIYLHSLRVALKVADYSKKSNPQFFNYTPIVIALLHDVIEDADSAELRQDLKLFETVENTIIKGIEALTNDKAEIEKIGRTKYIPTKFLTLARKDKELLLIKLADRVDNILCLDLIEGTPKYNEQTAYGDLFKTNYLQESLIVFLNFVNANIVIPNDLSVVYNEFLKLIATDKKF